MIIRQSTAVRIPVRCLNNTGIGVTGLLPIDFSDGTTQGNVTVVKSDGTLAAIALINLTNFFEIDALAAPGLYHVLVPLTATNLVGTMQLSVLPDAGAFLGTVATAQVESIAVDNELIRKITTNKWQIFTSGPDANRLVVFEDDDITPLVKFDLKDAAGSATTTNPFTRIPV